MPGRGRGVQGGGRKTMQRADNSQQIRPKQQQVSFDNNKDRQERDIWLLGDSIPYWAGMRAKFRKMPNLSLLGGQLGLGRFYS